MTCSGRRVGFELEFSSSRINIDINRLRLELSSVINRENHQILLQERSSAWTIKTDHCGYELTSPAFCATLSNFEKIKRVIKHLKEICNNYRIEGLPDHRNVCTPHCGMHVHINVDDFDLFQMKNLMKIFFMYENALLSINAPSRSCNEFVYLLQNESNPDDIHNRWIWTKNSINGIYEELSDHYHAVSFTRFPERGTIEIRYASSTTNWKKVVNWIQLLVLLVEFAKHTEENIHLETNKTIHDLKRFIMSIQTNTWLDGRRRNLVQWIDLRLEQLASYQAAMEERRAGAR